MKSFVDIFNEYCFENGLKKGAIALSMDVTLNNMGRMIRSKELRVDTITRLSRATKHNFFFDLAKELEREEKFPVKKNLLEDGALPMDLGQLLLQQLRELQREVDQLKRREEEREGPRVYKRDSEKKRDKR